METSRTTDPSAPPQPAVARRRRRWLVALAVLVLLVVALVAAPVWLGSDAGRAAVARRLEQYVSGALRGSMTIGSIESISPNGIVGRDVRFLHESGRLVLEAEEAELELDWIELASGRFVSRHGRVRGARIVLESVESGSLSISEAFAPARPGPAGEPIGADTVRLEGLVASDVEVLLDIRGAPQMRADHIAAIVRVRVPENGGAHVRADRIDGAVRIDAPIPVELTLDDGTLSIDGGARTRAVVELPAHLSGEAIRVEVIVQVTAADATHVAVHVIPSGIGAAFVSAPLVAQALLAETGTDALDVTIDLP